jgi:hypothetical protein
MAPIRDRPLLVDIHDSPETFRPEKDAVFVIGSSVEDRFEHIAEWRSQVPDLRFVQILEYGKNDFEYVVDPNSTLLVSLRSEKQMQEFWSGLGARTFYLDLTGFAHHVWAPLVRSCLMGGYRLIVIYVEPANYSYNVTPTEGEIFDLSERISGISPIPGFAALRETREEGACFVPLIGFEGRRLAYLVEQVQPPGGKIIPVIGVPGFRPEYPFHACLCNRTTLIETRCWKNMRFAAANDPFSLYYLLQEIAEENRGDVLKVAPIGTKPHALGAVLFAITSPKTVELVYDHPIRKAKRTQGFSRLLVYYVSTFLRV